MRMDPTQGDGSRKWLLSASEKDISEVLKNMGTNGLLFRLQRRLLLVAASR